MAPESGTEMEKLPSTSASVPWFVPLTTIVAPIIGSFVLESKTFPLLNEGQK